MVYGELSQALLAKLLFCDGRSSHAGSTNPDGLLTAP